MKPSSWLLGTVLAFTFTLQVHADDCESCRQKCEDDHHSCIEAVTFGDSKQEQEQMRACNRSYQSCLNTCNESQCKAPAKNASNVELPAFADLLLERW